MRETVKAIITLKKTWAFMLCLAFLAISLGVVASNQTGNSSAPEYSTSQISPKQGEHIDNATAVSDLKAQMADLKTEILQLEKTISQKEAENGNLKEQVNSLQCALRQIMSDLKNLEQVEQIRLLVERLRTEPPTSDVLP